MKILRIIARLNVGGPARHVTLLNAGLEERGHRTLLVHGPVGAGEASFEHLAAERGIPSIRHPHLGRHTSALSDLRALAALTVAVFRESPDVVHTHTAKAGALGRFAAFVFNATRGRRRRCLVVHTYHGHILDGYFHPLVGRILRATERGLAVVTDQIVTLSPSQRRDIVERFRIAASAQAAVVPLGLDLDDLLSMPAKAPSLRDRLFASPDEVVVGYAGRMVPIKDLPTLIRAFALALERHPRLRLVLAGDGPVRPTIEALAAELGVGQRVHFLGWTTDLRRFYATIDVCALSSLNEGTPVAVIEAMAAGKPVVATSVGGVPDVVEDGETGLLVPPRGAEALASAIVRLASDPEERSRMGELGRHRARERYSHTRLVADIERLYVEGLARKRG